LLSAGWRDFHREDFSSVRRADIYNASQPLMALARVRRMGYLAARLSIASAASRRLVLEDA